MLVIIGGRSRLRKILTLDERRGGTPQHARPPPSDGEPMNSDPGPPMTLGYAAAVRVRLMVWCKACQHQVEPDPAEMPICTALSSYLKAVTVHFGVL
jgi:hypothetical protein